MEKIENFKKSLIFMILLIISILFICSLQTSFAIDQSIDNETDGGIASAIDKTNPHETVTLASGTYNKINQDRNITINKSVTIQGNGSPESVKIDGEKTSGIFRIVNNISVTFINITFMNGNSSYGGAIDCQNSDHTLTFINCLFINNMAANEGGAINNPGGTINLINSNFTNNTAHNGGAIINDFATVMNISNCNFINNKATNSGGAIFDNYCFNTIITNSSFINNTANNSGGAIYNFGSNNNLLNLNFINNTAKNGGAIYNRLSTTGWWGYINIYVTNSNFTNNTAKDNGGAIYTNGTLVFGEKKVVIISNSNFVYNIVQYAAGGAIASYDSNMSVISSNFTNNFGNFAGAIYNTKGSMNVKTSNFINNQGRSGGGAIYNAKGSMDIKSSNFTNNTSPDGGAIGSNYDVMKIDDSIFINNSARGNGGAIKNIRGYLYLTNSKFINNTASRLGGAIYNGQYLFVKNNTMINNTAENGNDYYNNGNMGVLYLTFVNNGIVNIGPCLGRLTAKLTDDMGNLVSGGNVTFVINNTLIIGTADVYKGYAVLVYTPTLNGLFPLSGNYSGSVKSQINIIGGFINSTARNTNIDPNSTNRDKNKNPHTNVNLGKNFNIKNTADNLVTAGASMKKTGIPIISIILFVLTLFAVGIRKK